MKKSLLLSLLLAAQAAGAVTLDDIQKRFAAVPVMRAQFEQERQIKGMTQPLHSSGRIVVTKHKGLWWQQRQPFPMRLVVGENRMVQVMGNQPPQAITAESNPQMFQFNQLLRSLFYIDRKTLEKDFISEFSDLGEGKWRLVLIPFAETLSGLFRSITLYGEKSIDRIELNDVEDDSTEITFTHYQFEPRRLSQDERKRFVF
ncbi:outer membrane lipoprotein carrier protein LolA [Cedecea neteri]|uniref:outer membrane lipoprotein carrier protein LolA n=1 Tax=Cedecea neteri TaxID=158822 RepID=UPI0005D7D356|nr:outer membrane lipoprotein carrier protein LolA [Cedecea neteri]AJZ88946.1 membrane protein [Klebsiella michiganensis]WPU21437.1 outer membrane lipoprotein carrier protein LolA [Cedecea neteri]